jgi:hypothetical protein
MPMLFVGCSLKTDRTMSLIARIAMQSPNLKHFALLSEGERSRQRLHDLDVVTIRPIFYAAKEYDRIDNFLACLADYVRRTESILPNDSRSGSDERRPAHGLGSKRVAPTADDRVLISVSGPPISDAC